MRLPVHRFALPALALAALVAAPAAQARHTTKGVDEPAKVTLGATVKQCVPATDDATGGQATFVGSMPARADGGRMEMRFALQRETDATTGFEALSVPKFSQWVKSKPGRTGFVYRKKVVGLTAPASYRVVVTFRWRGPDGAVVKKSVRTSKPCRQPDARADLAPVKVTGTATGDGTAAYGIVVRNTGRTAAGEFTVALGASPGGADPIGTADVIGGLGAKSTTTVTVTGPQCAPGSSLTVVVDPDGLVVERDETNNALTVACPFAPRR